MPKVSVMNNDKKRADGRPLPATRTVSASDTLPELIRDEMRLRGHNQADVSRLLETSEGNVSRWIHPRDPQVPDGKSEESWKHLKGLVKYLRLPSDEVYAVLWLRTIKKTYGRK